MLQVCNSPMICVGHIYDSSVTDTAYLCINSDYCSYKFLIQKLVSFSQFYKLILCESHEIRHLISWDCSHITATRSVAWAPMALIVLWRLSSTQKRMLSEMVQHFFGAKITGGGCGGNCLCVGSCWH